MRKYTKIWGKIFSDSLENFLNKVIYDIDDTEIKYDATLYLCQFNHLCNDKLKGIITFEQYQLESNRIMLAAREDILKKINNHYLPILPVNAIAGTCCSQYSIQYQEIQEWKYIGTNNIRNHIGIRISGDSMSPDFSSGQILVCSQVSLEEAVEKHFFVILTKDNCLYLKKIKKYDDRLELISTNSEYEKISISREEILEIWQVK